MQRSWSRRRTLGVMIWRSNEAIWLSGTRTPLVELATYRLYRSSNSLRSEGRSRSAMPISLSRSRSWLIDRPDSPVADGRGDVLVRHAAERGAVGVDLQRHLEHRVAPVVVDVDRPGDRRACVAFTCAASSRSCWMSSPKSRNCTGMPMGGPRLEHLRPARATAAICCGKLFLQPGDDLGRLFLCRRCAPGSARSCRRVCSGSIESQNRGPPAPTNVV